MSTRKWLAWHRAWNIEQSAKGIRRKSQDTGHNKKVKNLKLESDIANNLLRSRMQGCDETEQGLYFLVLRTSLKFLLA
jgi:hypothetical protein